MLTTHNEPARMNLQMFGDGESQGEPQGEPQAVNSAAQQTSSAQQDQRESIVDFFNKFLQEGNSAGDQNNSPEGNPPVEPSTPEPESEPLILGKFKSQADLEKAYVEAEKRISQYGQQFSQNQRQIEQMQAQLYQLQQFVQRLQEPQQPQLTPEEIQERNQQWLDKFYEDPLGMLNDVINASIQQAINPLANKIQFKERVDYYSQQVLAAKAKYPDFDDYRPQMEAIIKEQGQYLAGLPNAVEVIYNMAKAQSAKSPDDYLQDEEFRKKILVDESIRNEILKQYAQQVASGQPPVVLGKQQGEIPAVEPVEIKNTQDAKKASIAFFQRILGGGSK